MESSISDSGPCSIQPETKETTQETTKEIIPEITSETKPVLASLSTFEKNLWGQCEPLHKRTTKRLEIYENLFKKVETIYSGIMDLMKTFKDNEFNLLKNYSTRTSIVIEKDDKGEVKKILKIVPNTLISIKNILEQNFEQFNQILSSILIIFANYIKNIKEEKKEHDDFLKLYNSYTSSFTDRQKTLEKNMKLYHQKGHAAEKAVLGLKKIEETQENFSDDISYLKAVEKANNSVDEYLKPYNIYKNSIKKENDLRMELIKKQKNLLKLYYDLENKNEILNEDILQIFIQYSNNQLTFVKENKEDFDFMKKSLIKGENINDLINEFGSNEKPDEEIKFTNFPSIIDFDMCDSDKTFKIFLESILFIKKWNNEEYPDFDEENEKEKNDMREVINKLFNNYTEENEAKIMNYLNNPSRHNSFFTILSKFRNKNSLNKDKKLFNMLGNILNIILDVAYINKNLENAKNCIIFSQTFFYNSEDNKKHFLLEKIKNHKWINTLDFWHDFIFINLNKELNKFISFYDDITLNDIEEKNEKITDKIRFKLSDLLFSQLLPYMNNMSQIDIDKQIIEKIIVEFCSKFKYLDEEKINGLLGMVFKENKEIKKIKEKIKDSIIDYNPDKNNENNPENKIKRKEKKKRSLNNINYDHLKKEEKEIENPL